MIKTLSDESLVKLDRLLKYHASKIRPTKGSDPKVFHDGIVVYYGVVTVEITAFNSETNKLGRGEAKLQYSPLNESDDRVLSDLGGGVDVVSVVFNISGVSYGVGRRITILQHVDGTLFVLPAVSGGGAAIIGFRVLSAGPFEYADLPECESAIRVTAEVTEVACGLDDISIGDRVTIWDPRHCKFDLPIEVLIGALGTAVKMQNTMVSDYGPIEPSCTEYEDLADLDCRWVVTDLTCCEEIYGCD